MALWYPTLWRRRRDDRRAGFSKTNARGPEETEETPPLLLAKGDSAIMKIFSICCVRDENDIIGETLEAANLERQDICV
jgi:hypothetical protein